MPVVQEQVDYWKRQPVKIRFQNDSNMPAFRIPFDRPGFMTQYLKRLFELFLYLVTIERGLRRGSSIAGGLFTGIQAAETLARAVTTWDASC
jgi:hypothetical protein